MPKSIHYSDLQQKLDTRSQLARSEVNSVFEGVKQLRPGNTNTLLGGYGHVFFDKAMPVPNWVDFYINTNLDIPAYSIFTIKDSVSNSYWPFGIEIDKCQSARDNKVLLTNGESPVISTGTGKGTGICRPIDYLQPTTLGYVDDDDFGPPVVGEEVGPVPNTLVVSAKGAGLLVLAIDTLRKYVKVVPAIQDTKIYAVNVPVGLAPGDPAEIELPTGETVIAINQTEHTFHPDDRATVYQDQFDDGWYLVGSREPDEAPNDNIWYGVATMQQQPGVVAPIGISSGIFVDALNYNEIVPIYTNSMVHVYQDSYDDSYIAIRPGCPVWKATASANISIGGGTGNVLLSDGNTVVAKNWDNVIPIVTGDKLHVYCDIFDGQFIAIKAGGAQQRFLYAQLNGDLANTAGAAAIDNVTYPGGAAVPGPAITSADNFLGWAGSDNDNCLILEHLGGGAPVRLLVAVKWGTSTFVQTVFGLGDDIKQTRQQVLSKVIGAPITNTIVTTEIVAPVVSVTSNPTDLNIEYRDIRTIVTVPNNSTISALSFEEPSVVMDVSSSTTALEELFRTIRTIARTDDSDTSVIADIDECSTTSAMMLPESVNEPDEPPKLPPPELPPNDPNK